MLDSSNSFRTVSVSNVKIRKKFRSIQGVPKKRSPTSKFDYVKMTWSFEVTYIYLEAFSFLFLTIFLLDDNKIFSASGHFKMHQKTLLISFGNLKSLILKILNVHADTEHWCNQTKTQNIESVNCKIKNLPCWKLF